MGTKMTIGSITIEVFSGADIDFYKRAGYWVVEETPKSPEPEAPAEETPKSPEAQNAEAVETVNKPKAKK